jgi:hypothetical protein
VHNKRSAKKLGLNGFARFLHAGKLVIGRYEVAPQTQLFGYRQPLGVMQVATQNYLFLLILLMILINIL